MREQISDKDVLLSELSDEADMHELIEMFVNELPHRIEAIVQALEGRDIQKLAGLAHQLKGAAGGYGYPTITDAASRLELASKSGETVDLLKSHYEDLANLCHRACAAIV